MLQIKIVKELPQWIISSDLAAYHPYSDTIYLRKDKKYLLLHELGHYIIEKLTKNRNIHNKYDNLYSKIKGGSKK